MTQRWTLGQTPWLGDGPARPAARRVIIDDDFAGDPDDLFQLVHHLLSPPTDFRGVVCSHLRPGDPFCPDEDSAATARDIVHEVFSLMGLDSTDRIWLGAPVALADATTPHRSEAALKIVEEALREDARPLYVVAGGRLTDLVSAWLIEPAIAERLMVIWIGGPEYPDLATEPSGIANPEYNLRIDLLAGRILFNDSNLPLWQVTRDGYRQCLVSDAELHARIAPCGPIRHLHGRCRPARPRHDRPSGAGAVRDVRARRHATRPALQQQDMWTIPLAVQGFSSQHATSHGPPNAFIILSAIPVLIVYLLFQRYFVSGAFAGAVKG